MPLKTILSKCIASWQLKDEVNIVDMYFSEIF